MQSVSRGIRTIVCLFAFSLVAVAQGNGNPPPAPANPAPAPNQPVVPAPQNHQAGQSSRPLAADCTKPYSNSILPIGLSLTSKKVAIGSAMMVYTEDDYNRDIQDYEIATNPGCIDESAAQFLRNKIVYGLEADIDIIFSKDFIKHFGVENGLAVLGDVLTLGATATSSIATNTATKTVFAALGTAFGGLNLSIQKNYFGQQSFQILGTAMQTGRTKLATTIDAGAQNDVTAYNLEKAKGDLRKYYTAGTLPGALSELQIEATAAKQTAEKQLTDLQP